MLKESLETWKKFEIKLPEKKTNSKQMSYIVEDATKAISNLHKIHQLIKNRFETKFCLENSFFVHKVRRNFF